MRRVFLCLVVCLSLVVSAFAADGTGEDSGEAASTESGTTVYIENEIIIPNDEALASSVSFMSLSPVTSADATGFKAVILSLIGDYDPVIIEYQYENANGYTSYLREVEPDYAWLCSAAIFLVVLYCVFRLGGALFCKR